MPLLSRARIYWRFILGLRGFFKDTITLQQSEDIIRRRLQNREKNLLLLMKNAVYGNKGSPYLQLLKLAGCEYGDFERLVQSNGAELTLKRLAAEGVYLSIEEFKGNKEVNRNGKIFRFKENDFNNPFISGHIETRSGASRSAGTRTIYDFGYLTDNRVVYLIPMLHYCGVDSAPFALWWPIFPGPGPMVMICYTKAGNTPMRWFSLAKQGLNPSLEMKVGSHIVALAGRLSGAKLPRPEYLSPDESWKVAEWMAGITKKHGSCIFSTYPSLAVRICSAAKMKGIDLTGVKFLLNAEPITKAKQKEIDSVGATTSIKYAFTEAGFVGLGCLSPSATDDVHLCKDSLVLVQQPREVPYAATAVEAFLFTTLLSSAPKILLNVESGDWGMVETGSCGCKLEKLGLTDHLYNIRGFDKLTGEGMTFIGTDLVRIIEEVLPAKFGGTSTDYQMLEDEDERGYTRMSVLASPELGAIDEAELVKTILAELGKRSSNQRMMADVWAQAKTLRVQRKQPLTTARGKLMPLHIKKS
jgi:hypothetical protein